MIINEKQIMELIIIARNSIELMEDKPAYEKYREKVCYLIDVITTQQSKELKVIKNEFKVGDEVWWFEGPDQNTLLELDDLQVCHSPFLREDKNYIWTTECGLAKFTRGNAYFKSKQEAIDAMINRLNKLKNETGD